MRTRNFPARNQSRHFVKILSKLYIIFQTVMSEMVVLYSQKCHFCKMKNIQELQKSKIYILWYDDDDNSELQSAVTGVQSHREQLSAPRSPISRNIFPIFPVHNSLQNLLSAVVQTPNKICRGGHLRRAAVSSPNNAK